MQNLFQDIENKRSEYVEQLIPFVAIPGISTTGECMDAAVDYLESFMVKQGLSVRRLDTGHFPILFAEIKNPKNTKTLLFLCHYDVVPAGALDKWTSPPFEPTIRDNRIYARGVGDNKGQLLASLFGVSSWLKNCGDLPVNIKFIFVGDEETGCTRLSDEAMRYSEEFAADAVLFLDASTLDVWGPVAFLANRGILALELEAKGPEKPLHSGSYGHLVKNPALRLAQALSSLRDRDGRVTIPGFYDTLNPIGETEQGLLANLSVDKAEKLKTLGTTSFWGDPGYSYFETQMYRPVVNIHGLTSGYQDEGWVAMVPATATAKLDITLVPDLDPEIIKAQIRKHLDEQGFTDVELREVAMEPYAEACKPDDSFLQVVMKAQEKVWGKKTVLYPSIGGGGNIVKAFKDVIKVPHFLMIPLAQPDLNEHSSDESLDIDWYINGIKTVVAIIEEYGKAAD